MAKRTELLRTRTFRTTDGQWEEANDAASWNNEDISPVIRRLLDQYIEETNIAKRAKAARTDA